jgi:hypothetical protein
MLFSVWEPCMFEWCLGHSICDTAVPGDVQNIDYPCMWSLFVKIIWIWHVICRIIWYINIFTDGSCSVHEVTLAVKSWIYCFEFLIFILPMQNALVLHMVFERRNFHTSSGYGNWEAVICSFSQIVGHNSGGVRHWLLTTEVWVIPCEFCGEVICTRFLLQISLVFSYKLSFHRYYTVNTAHWGARSEMGCNFLPKWPEEFALCDASKWVNSFLCFFVRIKIVRILKVCDSGRYIMQRSSWTLVIVCDVFDIYIDLET